ncbi:MAG: hypothetical protein HY762_03440 [Planctomycetes bacterium]|nr:hypothetical protein [Planctomycetota bacterium]
MRQLDEKFMDTLTNGFLKDILKYVQSDNTLDLEIRENYLNIYYRGGNILDVRKNQKDEYEFSFNFKYLKSSSSLSSDKIEKSKKAMDWNIYFPIAKQAMDFSFSGKANEEREFQQLVVRENNYSTVANGTDYFIVDIESELLPFLIPQDALARASISG